MTAVIARWLAFAALALSVVPVVSVAAYALLPPRAFTTNAVASFAAWTYVSATPIIAALAVVFGRGTPARRRGTWALGLWAFVIAFLIYQFAFR